MSDELKPCPFCGEPGKFFEDDRDSNTEAWCTNRECNIGCDWPMPVSKWNTRPIEDALRAEVERLKAEYDELQVFKDDAINLFPELDNLGKPMNDHKPYMTDQECKDIFGES